MAYQKSDYENYILVSQHTKMLGGTYPKYLKTKQLICSLNSMVGKQSNTYIYNGESYVSSLTSAEIQKIQSALDYVIYNSSVEKLKYIFNDIGDRLF